MSDPPADDLGVDEHFGHIKARPVSWVVVILVCGGFLVTGIGLIAANPVVFWIGAGVVAVGTVLGGVTHAMADVTSQVDTSGTVVDGEAVR
jgi:hypothetical protein